MTKRLGGRDIVVIIAFAGFAALLTALVAGVGWLVALVVTGAIGGLLDILQSGGLS